MADQPGAPGKGARIRRVVRNLIDGGIRPGFLPAPVQLETTAPRRKGRPPLVVVDGPAEAEAEEVPRLATVGQTARHLRLGENTLKRLIEEATLPCGCCALKPRVTASVPGGQLWVRVPALEVWLRDGLRCTAEPRREASDV